MPQHRSMAVMPQRRSTAASSLMEKVGIFLLSTGAGVAVGLWRDHYYQEQELEELRKVSGCALAWVSTERAGGVRERIGG